MRVLQPEEDEWDLGCMFDPADWTDEELRVHFPHRHEELIAWKRENIEANPSYYHIAVSGSQQER